MAGIPIPPEMLPRMDWHAEDKSAAWEHFTTRLKLYYTVAHTPKEVQVDTILFFAGTEATDRWKTLKEQMSAEDQVSSDKVFEAFANSFEKSSSYWQAREEYLSGIKQNKQQTAAELDIYIKDLVRRCQFTRTEVEARKIDLLYHATVHFEVRKFVHNAKPEELTYDRMIEVAKAHEWACHEYQQHKQAHSVPVSSYQNPLIQTNAVRKSFQKLGHVANVGGAIPKDSALFTDRCATAVGGKAIGHRCVGPGGALLPDVHHHHTLPTDREDHRAASHSSSREEEEARAVTSSSRKVALPTSTRKEVPLPRRHTRSSW